MKTKKLAFALGLLLVSSAALIAQTSINPVITYKYDLAGNRSQRVCVTNSNSNRLALAQNPASAKPEETAKQRAVKFGISIFPSVVKDFLHIRITDVNEQLPASVTVFNSEGKVSDIKLMLTGTTEQLNFETLKNGIYILKVQVKDEVLLYKVLKN